MYIGISHKCCLTATKRKGNSCSEYNFNNFPLNGTYIQNTNPIDICLRSMLFFFLFIHLGFGLFHSCTQIFASDEYMIHSNFVPKTLHFSLSFFFFLFFYFLFRSEKKKIWLYQCLRFATLTKFNKELIRSTT